MDIKQETHKAKNKELKTEKFLSKENNLEKLTESNVIINNNLDQINVNEKKNSVTINQNNVNYNFFFSDFFNQESELNNNNIFNDDDLKENNFYDKYNKKEFQKISYYNPYDYKNYSNDKSDNDKNKINANIIRNNIEPTIKDKSIISKINEFPINLININPLFILSQKEISKNKGMDVINKESIRNISINDNNINNNKNINKNNENVILNNYINNNTITNYANNNINYYIQINNYKALKNMLFKVIEINNILFLLSNYKGSIFLQKCLIESNNYEISVLFDIIYPQISEIMCLE